jgi:HK97 gp10 family phage protein
MALKHVKGLNSVLSGFKLYSKVKTEKIKDAVEQTTVGVLNNAESRHGANAHAQKRYENQTMRLTQSFRNTDATVSRGLLRKRIEAATYTDVDYAPNVEYGTIRNRAYPFLYPALEDNRANLRRRLRRALI